MSFLPLLENDQNTRIVLTLFYLSIFQGDISVLESEALPDLVSFLFQIKPGKLVLVLGWFVTPLHNL